MDISTLRQTPEFEQPPSRVVSLVPSLTESLFALGFGGSVVGVSDYCAEPAGKLGSIQRVGGPKEIAIQEVLSLAPDLVFANQEENSAGSIQALIEAGINVWLTFPKTVEEALDVLRGLLAIYHTDRVAMQINTLQMTVDYAQTASDNQPRKRYFCPIWQGEDQGHLWWMTFNQESYAHDVLRVVGGENVFASRQRQYPLGADLGLEESEDAGERDTRYPRVTAAEVIAADPELILLPNEPFHFDEKSKSMILAQFGETKAVKNNNIVFIDGRLITWHGVRLGRALQELPWIFS